MCVNRDVRQPRPNRVNAQITMQILERRAPHVGMPRLRYAWNHRASAALPHVCFVCSKHDVFQSGLLTLNCLLQLVSRPESARVHGRPCVL